MWLFAIFVAVPVIEIALFIQVGGLIGTWPTIGIIILTALTGSTLLRGQGLSVLRSAQARLAAGENPGALVAEGAMLLVAGLLMITPGFFTDTVGFLLLVPAVRRFVWRWIAARAVVTTHVHMRTGPGPARGGTTVEGEFEEVDPDSGRNDPPQVDRR